MRSSRRARRHIEAAELNITAFMNLMVILVPFLLITAVFSRLAILELNLPASSSVPAEEPEQTLQLEITVRTDAIEIGDRSGFLLSRYINTEEGYALDKLSTKLQEIKKTNPDKEDVTVLLEPDISYDVLVQIMDTVRLYEVVDDGEILRKDLFPQISIGDAVAAIQPQPAEAS
ncbi:MAG: biopolymer transporter ExbD [Pseudomonadota bacterium]